MRTGPFSTHSLLEKYYKTEESDIIIILVLEDIIFSINSAKKAPDKISNVSG